MTRRELLFVPAPIFVPTVAQDTLMLPVHRVLDKRRKNTPEQDQNFTSRIWPEAVRDFERCGIRLGVSQSSGEVRRSPSNKPVIEGLVRGAINVVVTDSIPLEWDNGRAVAGVTTSYQGFHLCMIALRYAHPHQIPFFSVNTCVHELLHVLLRDVLERRPKGLTGEAREFRIDLYATRLWLFYDCSDIRHAAEGYVRTMQPRAM